MNTVNGAKQQLTDWEKIVTNPTSNKGLISNIYKELKKLDSREPNYSIKNCIELNKNSQTRNIGWVTLFY
jgi:hypothetical protein